MALENAQQFVLKMKEDREFRQHVSGVSNKDALWDMVKEHGYSFDEKDLACAMAACMNEMDQCGRSDS